MHKMHFPSRIMLLISDICYLAGPASTYLIRSIMQFTFLGPDSLFILKSMKCVHCANCSIGKKHAV